MTLPFLGGRTTGRLALIPVVITLIALSLLVAAPAQVAAATASPSLGNTQVVPTVLQGYRDSGPLEGSTAVLVTVGIPLQNVQQLEYLTQQASIPGSSTYHHFLTQAEAQAYLPQAQYEQALDYLTGHGLDVVSSSLDSIIVAEGTASQVSQSLGLKYAVYTNGSETYYTSSGVSPIPNVYLYSSNVTAVFLQHPTDLVTPQTISSVDAGRSSQTNQTIPAEGYPLVDLQSAYNATALYAAGFKGSGYTAGVLDFYGDPYIAQQLKVFDEVYNLPSSPFSITTIGPYNPSLGVEEGWDSEISLDVESVHAMAPEAGIDLYVANGALPLSAAIAAIVQDDKVNDVTQSFGTSESMLSEIGATGLELNVLLADQYYLLGSAEGITFIASTGDSGGAGFSGGPAGNPSYPSTSPYVVAVGGTTTYLTYNGDTVTSSEQTAWSSYGFVPYQQNYGGSTGGVSILEPTPWYQSGLALPKSFGSGRMVPDVSLNAGISPAVEVILPGNATALYGGTSESNQLFGGLLTLLMGAAKSPFGLLNPTLYDLGKSSSTYSKAYDPVTFGYTIPWVASSGYNLVTGFGAPNIGEMARYVVGSLAPSALAVNVTAISGHSPATEVLPGQTVEVSALVTSGSSGAPVSTGTFEVYMDTLSGTVASAPLTYSGSSRSWTGSLVVPGDAAGISYVTVNGTSSGSTGIGFVQVYAGYVATFLSPGFDEPYSTAFGLPLEVNVTTLAGTPDSGPVSFTASTYSISSNTYTKVATVTLDQIPGGSIWIGNLTGPYPNGPILLSGAGDVYGELPFINGVSLQSSFVEPSVLTPPGSVAPGQSLYFLGELAAPLNTPAAESLETGLPVAYNVEVGSNVTMALVNPAGKVLASSQFYLNSYLSTETLIQGGMTVPSGAAPGVYDVMLSSSYYSPDLETWINGSYFAQVYVAAATTTITTSVSPSTAYQGQVVTVNAKIAYENGTAVKYGMYSATVYPNGLQNAYNYFSEYVNVPLWYQSSTGFWTANVTLPSAYNSGGTVDVDPGALYLSGPYDVFVSGVTADGVPANTSITNQEELQVQPYLYLDGLTLTGLPQSSGLAFLKDTISGPSASGAAHQPLSLSNDVFIGSNIVQGAVTIYASQIQGTLYLQDANVSLVGVTGGSIVAESSNVVLEQSSLNSLDLADSHVAMNGSTVSSISPPLPTVSIQSPGSEGIYKGTSGNFTVTGSDLSSVSVYVDGVLLKTLSPSGSYSVPLDGSTMAVGVHTFEVVAEQGDGLSTSASVYFSTDGPLVAASNSITSLTAQVSSENSRMDSLGAQLNTAEDISYILALVAVLALIIALVAVTRRPSASSSGAGAQQSAEAPPPPSSTPPAETPPAITQDPSVPPPAPAASPDSDI